MRLFRDVIAAPLATALVIGALTLTLVFIVTPAPDTPRDVIAALPGVGYGWLDTLERVAGRPMRIDTITPLEFYDMPSDLLGLFEPWHMTVSIQPHMVAYSRYIRHASDNWCAAGMDGWFGPVYRHPLAMANPAGVTAHEFGHWFQFGLWPHGGIHAPYGESWPDDTLPAYARDNSDERFADRFARAMLALRGWDDPDPLDRVLTHRVRYLLMKSYWPVNEKTYSPAPVVSSAAPDGTTVHASTHKHKAKKSSHRDF